MRNLKLIELAEILFYDSNQKESLEFGGIKEKLKYQKQPLKKIKRTEYNMDNHIMKTVTKSRNNKKTD